MTFERAREPPVLFRHHPMPPSFELPLETCAVLNRHRGLARNYDPRALPTPDG